MAASAKTGFISEGSILQFFAKHPVVFYWTFTFIENLTDKAEAERRFKKFQDLLRRRGAEWLHVWEPQKRGAWHVHLITDVYLDVNWLRPWMVQRGFGPIMKVYRIERGARWIEGRGWVADTRDVEKLCRYLRKYLTKSRAESKDGKKAFGGGGGKRWKSMEDPGRPGPKVGNTRFAWNPWQDNPMSYLLQMGRLFYRELNGCWPPWEKDAVLRTGWFQYLIKLGYEYTNWGDYDPFFVVPGYG
jgi:hypothetical protein